MSSHPNAPREEINPYAVTTTTPYGLKPNTDFRNEIYRSDRWLVMHKQAVLPNRCIKSNEPTEERLKRNLYWHHPGFYLLIFFNLLVYAIVALAIRKSAVIYVPLASRFKRRRLLNMLIAWLIVFAAIGCLFLGGAMSDRRTQSTIGVILLVMFPVLLLTGALFGLFGCRVVYAKKIDDQFVWLGGVAEEFRQSFPQWPY